MISIGSTTFDLEGHFQFEPSIGDVVPQAIGRRVSRASTLDGGVAISDRGFSHGDRTLEYTYRPASIEQDAILERIVRIHPTVTVTSPDGAFLAVPETLFKAPDGNTIRLLAIQKISED